ncbi:hypothetical protein PV11_05511 [Exophiala sideris]|uniref:Uncharacterized protein n=1 Tax=Exophiala sideris TaxID=1016849 RepID=A0A0D1W435_9EURO|nr:hypothetical protein PV11_05511 [Exophiala sideris]
MASIAQQPDLRQKLLSDELETFSSYVKESAVLTTGNILLDGTETSYKLFGLDKSSDGKLALPLTSHVVRHVRSDTLSNDYTQTSSLQYKAVHEIFFSDLKELEHATVHLRKWLPALAEDGLLPASQRRMFGQFEGEVFDDGS